MDCGSPHQGSFAIVFPRGLCRAHSCLLDAARAALVGAFCLVSAEYAGACLRCPARFLLIVSSRNLISVCSTQKQQALTGVREGESFLVCILVCGCCAHLCSCLCALVSAADSLSQALATMAACTVGHQSTHFACICTRACRQCIECWPCRALTQLTCMGHVRQTHSLPLFATRAVRCLALAVRLACGIAGPLFATGALQTGLLPDMQSPAWLPFSLLSL